MCLKSLQLQLLKSRSWCSLNGRWSWLKWASNTLSQIITTAIVSHTYCMSVRFGFTICRLLLMWLQVYSCPVLYLALENKENRLVICSVSFVWPYTKKYTERATVFSNNQVKVACRVNTGWRTEDFCLCFPTGILKLYAWKESWGFMLSIWRFVFSSLFYFLFRNTAWLRLFRALQILIIQSANKSQVNLLLPLVYTTHMWGVLCNFKGSQAKAIWSLNIPAVSVRCASVQTLCSPFAVCCHTLNLTTIWGFEVRQ